LIANNTLLITVATAALMAGSGLVSAQDMKGNREAPTAAAADQKAPVGKTDQHPASLPQKSSPPTAQAPLKEKRGPTAQTPVKEKPGPTAQAPVKEKQAPSVAKDETKSVAPGALSAEQHAKIWSTLRGEKAERLTNVEFSTTVGGVIPRTVHLYRLPVSIVEYVPQYRGYEYILVGDEILIVDPRTLRIVAVIAA
jgi:cell division septation protein DedD